MASVALFLEPRGLPELPAENWPAVFLPFCVCYNITIIIMKHHNYGYKFAFKERTSCDKVRAKLFREMKMAQLIIGIIGMLSIKGVTYVPNTSIYFDNI